MSSLKHLPKAFHNVDTKFLYRSFFWALIPVSLAASLSRHPDLVFMALVPPVTLVLSKILLELQFPELGHYRHEVRRKAYPQAAFYLIKALQRLKARPWLQRFNLLRPRASNKVLYKHLESELASVRLLAGELDEAERMLRRLSDEGVAEGWVHHNLAVVLSVRGAWKEARPHILLARALGVAPPHSRTRLSAFLCRRFAWSRDPHLDWVAEVGLLYQALGFHEFALQCLSLSKRPEKCFQCVTSLVALQRLPEAETQARAASRQEPENSWNWLALGQVQFLAGNHGEAILHLSQALSLDPENKVVKTVYYEMKIWNSTPKQLRDLLSLVEEYEEDFTVRCIMEACILGELGDWEQSLKTVEKIIDRFMVDQALPGLEVQALRFLECLGYSLINVGVPYVGVSYLSMFCDLSERADIFLLRRQERRDKAMEFVEHFVASPF